MKTKFIPVSASELVILAIHNLEVLKKDYKGSTPNEITKFISEKYKLDFNKIKPNVNTALLRGLTFGIFTQKDGLYQLEDVPQPHLTFKRNPCEAEKCGAMIVEASKHSIRKKRDKKGDVKVDDTLRPLVHKIDEGGFDRHLAKRRKGKPKDEDEEDRLSTFSGF